MSAVVLDSGALIELERNNRKMWTLLRELSRREVDVLVPSTVLAQCWRTSSKQARLHAALIGCSISPFDPMARRVGELLGRSKTKDVCDAHVALVAALYADTVFTGDPDDIQHLLAFCSPGVPLVIAV